MDMNKKGQQIILSIMLSIIVLILVIAFSAPLKESITISRNTTHLNASNFSGMSTANQATLIVLDMSLFYFIGTLIAVSIAFVTGKKTVTGVITAIVVFILVSVLVNPLKDLIILARDSSHLDCTNAAITVGGKLACIIVDIWLFYFAVAAIAAAITYIFMKEVVPKIEGEQ